MLEKQKRTARILSLMLIISMLLPVAAGAVSVSDFRDVKSGDWFYSAVDFAVDAGLFNGKSDTVFAPNDPMTRGMFVTVLGRRVGVVTSGYPGTEFSDVSSSMYYAPYINWAYEHEIVSGTGNGKFSPDANITRQDLVTLIYRFMENPSLGKKALIQDVWNYTDYYDISGYAYDAIDWAFTNGVVSGVSSTRLDPHGTATRAQVAQIFKNADELFGGTPQPTPEPGGYEETEAVLDAIDDRLESLLDGSEVSVTEVMSEMTELAQELEDAGEIKNLDATEEGIFFDYADGTIGGIVMELPSTEAEVEQSGTTVVSADELAQAADIQDFQSIETMQTTSSVNIIGRTATKNEANKKILIAGYPSQTGSDGDESDFISSYRALEKKFNDHSYDFDVKVKTDGLTVDGYKTLGEYGAVFLYAPSVVWDNNSANILLNQYFSPENHDATRKDRDSRMVGLYSVISPENPRAMSGTNGTLLASKSYFVQASYVIMSRPFFDVYATNLQNSFIHLGFQNSGSSKVRLNTVLVGNGAGAVTGFDGITSHSHNIKVVNAMLDTFLKDESNEVGDAVTALKQAGLSTLVQKLPTYKDTTWALVTKTYTTTFEEQLKDGKSDLVLWEEPPGPNSALLAHAEETLNRLLKGDLDGTLAMFDSRMQDSGLSIHSTWRYVSDVFFNQGKGVLKSRAPAEADPDNDYELYGYKDKNGSTIHLVGATEVTALVVVEYTDYGSTSTKYIHTSLIYKDGKLYRLVFSA